MILSWEAYEKPSTSILLNIDTLIGLLRLTPRNDEGASNGLHQSFGFYFAIALNFT